MPTSLEPFVGNKNSLQLPQPWVNK
jgi:hypothetical protein